MRCHFRDVTFVDSGTVSFHLMELDVQPQVLTVSEVASFLRVNPKTVYALAKRGELSSFRVGRAMRFTRKDVQAFVERGTQPEETR
ncbi:MAG: helix-turn-helix domain-containing protein [Deltaproteobacteria bacterium]|nr:helix-turn-helix domain-containing protein [Deltaproteobacteria bacterium]